MTSREATRISELERDVAQLAQERAELFSRLAAVETERAKHVIAFAMAAHQIFSPLQALTMSTDLMTDRLAGCADESPRQWLLGHLAMQQQSLARLHELLRMWLIAPELQAGMLVSRCERCDLAELVGEVIAQHKADIAWAGCAVELELIPVPAQWDRLVVDTVISNVVGNAIKYGARNPIRISITRTSDDDFGSRPHAVIAVRDHGIGVARADRERIFQRLERGEGVSRLPGMGVGLWICRAMLRNIGGSIEVDGAPGRGAIFSIKLPISES